MNRLINYAYIHPSANKFELNYLQVLIFSDFFFESSIDIQSWIISILKYYMFVTSWYLPQCPHNFSHSQNTMLTRFILRSNQTRPKKTNRIREMSETCVMKIVLIAIQFSIQKILDPIDLYQIRETVLEQEQENIFFLATSQGLLRLPFIHERLASSSASFSR